MMGRHARVSQGLKLGELRRIMRKLEAIKAKRNQRRVVIGNRKQTRIIVLEICTRSLTVKISYLEYLISNSDI